MVHGGHLLFIWSQGRCCDFLILIASSISTWLGMTQSWKLRGFASVISYGLYFYVSWLKDFSYTIRKIFVLIVILAIYTSAAPVFYYPAHNQI